MYPHTNYNKDLNISGHIYLFMRVYEYKREARIQEIKEMLKEEAKEGNIHKRAKLITIISMKYNVSRRTASDYLNVAQFQNELE